MPSGEQINAIARAFHESYERQAPEYGYKTREASAVPWSQVPADNKHLMQAVVLDLLMRGVIRLGSQPTAVEGINAQRTPDSPRWCDHCRDHGDHHTDRHPV